MKKYIIDRLVLLAWGIWAMIYTPNRAGPIFTIIGEMMAIFIIVVFCHRILLLPLDLIVGKKQAVVYFSLNYWGAGGETITRKQFAEWKFYYGSNQQIRLLVPYAVPEGKILDLTTPARNQKVKITYYRYSKILCHWEPADD